jgi:hypothetical protein
LFIIGIISLGEQLLSGKYSSEAVTHSQSKQGSYGRCRRNILPRGALDIEALSNFRPEFLDSAVQAPAFVRGANFECLGRQATQIWF